MDITVYDLQVDFTSPLLGTTPGRDTVASDFLASKAEEPHEDEALTAPEEIERGTTGFHRLEGAPVLYDYVIKGFLKEAGLAFNGLRGVKALRSKVDNYVFVGPRLIELTLPKGGEVEFLERPLRARTARGPRITLARSEMLPAGTTLSCRLEVYDKGPISEALLRDLLDYGHHKGLGQWRNGGYGRFTYTLKKRNA